MGTSTPLGAVVVGVDRTLGSDQAVDWASDYATLTGRRLLAVHGTGFIGVRPSAQDLLDAERVVLEGGRVLVDDARDRAVRRHPGLAVSGVAEVSDPPTALLEHGSDAAMLVVGSRRGESRGRLFGSVSLTVTRHAPCPVVVVRPPGYPVPRALREEVVLGLDGTVASREAAAFAFEYCAMASRPLVVVHGSWNRLEQGSSLVELLTYSHDTGLTEEERLSLAETIAGLPEKYPDVEYREEHRAADPAEALIEASRSAGLVVVGSRRLGTAKAVLMRSVSTALVEHAHCPVAVVRDGD